jgi:uncharacterized protein (DUF697 family)/predicted GTPase
MGKQDVVVAVHREDLLKDFAKAYAAALKELGRVNLAIFGKTGTGKSTLINAMFGAEVAPTGIGDAVTPEPTYYEHPSGLFGLYDSKGVETGEHGDAVLESFRATVEDSRRRPLEEQIHVIWYVIRAGDKRFEHGQAEFVRALAELGLPVMVVLTQVPRRGRRIDPNAVTLAQSIRARELPIAPANNVFFTMAKPDAFNGIEAHGLKGLLTVSLQVAPDGVAAALTAVQRVDIERKIDAARAVVRNATAAAATAGAVPIPFADAAVLVPLQVGMMAKVAATFGLGLQKGTLASLAGAALSAGGITQLGKAVVTNLLKFVPGLNLAAGVIRAGVAASLTYAVGEAWISVCRYLHGLDSEAQAAVSPATVRRMFLTEFKTRARKAA